MHRFLGNSAWVWAGHDILGHHALHCVQNVAISQASQALCCARAVSCWLAETRLDTAYSRRVSKSKESSMYYILIYEMTKEH